CLLTGRDLLLLREKLDTVRRIVLIAVGEEGEVIKAFTIREERREEVRRKLEKIVEDDDECLRFRYSAFSDEALQGYFNITVYESVEEMVRDVFPAASSRRFEQVIQYVKSRYNPRLLDEHADEIGRAIKDILESAIRPPSNPQTVPHHAHIPRRDKCIFSRQAGRTTRAIPAPTRSPGHQPVPRVDARRLGSALFDARLIHIPWETVWMSGMRVASS
ncbi:MAG: hypothetical protein DRJ67_05960, partial [Thermoprotei archaeon]